MHNENKKNIREAKDSMARDAVIAGDYKGKGISRVGGPHIAISFKEEVYITKDTVESYQVMNQNVSTSASSGIARSIIGGALFGNAGALGGAASAKVNISYTIAINFKDGKRSLIEVNEKIYKDIVEACF